MIKDCFSHEIQTETRNLLSLELLLKQTGWLLPITGIPCDVPVPKKYTFNVIVFIYKNRVNYLSLETYFTNFANY